MSDRMIEFEEQNYNELVEKFLKIKMVKELWEDYVNAEYEDSLQDPPNHSEDR